ncbi:MAG: hypothetical protein IKB47_04220 [Clostridia bacterium]|nr:hypothetical protein [Clostridia bacterium]
MKYLLNGVSLPYTANDADFIDIAKQKMKRAADPAQFHFCIYKKSVDARRRGDIRFVCTVLAQSRDVVSASIAKRIASAGFKAYDDNVQSPKPGSEKLLGRPLIVGGGPAGMFCALILAENGYRPILIDRGGSVTERAAAYDKFCKNGILDKENNIQFGAGGAGTFSDGKLTTRISDPRCTYVLERLREFGAPDDVTVKAKPHIGTDVLRSVVENLYNRIRSAGGEIHLGCRLDRIFKNTDGSLTAITGRGEIVCGCAVLATGHSARDTYTMLMNEGFVLEAKPFSVGVRIEHLREDIDRALYGDAAGDTRLGHAEYNFSDTTGRGVYTFCMCPGGEVVAGATEDGGVVVNGMSCRARDGVNSNSAIAVSVNREDYGGDVVSAISYQRNLERAAFELGGGNYTAPMQTVGDFLSGSYGTEPTRVQPSYMGGGRCKVADLSSIFPSYITAELKRGIVSFGRRLHGFDSASALLTGVETRTSSPVRMPRGEELTALGNDLVYPCGEGAGYAGGITSAAVDGIRVAERIISRFAQ